MARRVRRVPRLLSPFVVAFRFPAVVLSVLFAATLLALAGAAGTLFLSSAGSAAVTASLARQSSVPALTVAAAGLMDSDLLTFRDKQLREAAASIDGLGTMTSSIVGSPVCLVTSESACRPGSPTVQPVTRTEAIEHLDALRRAGGQGVWISDTTARAAGGVGPGDSITLASGSGRATVRVAGIYRDFGVNAIPSFWEPLTAFIRGTGGPGSAPPQLLIGDQETIASIDHRLDEGVEFQWEFALAAQNLTLERAASLSAQLQGMVARLADPATQLGSAFVGSNQETPLPGVVAEALRAKAAAAGSVESVALAGQALALVGIGASGVYAVRRRRTEVALLASRGVGPARFGLDAAMEGLIPVAIGSVLGIAFAVELVRIFGPSSSVSNVALGQAWVDAAVGLGAGLLVLSAVAGSSAARQAEEPTNRGVVAAAGRAPWELILLALAGASFYEIVVRGSNVSVGADGVTRIDRLTLLFPVLFVAGVAGLAIRILRGALARRQAMSARRSPQFFLAARRLGSAPRLAAVLVTASALAVGIMTYAGTVASSLTATAREKALVAVGSNTAVGVPRDSGDVPPGVSATRVLRALGARLEPSGKTVDLLGVHGETFGTQAFWDPRFAATSLGTVLRSTRSAAEGRLPVIAVGDVPAGSTLYLFQAAVPFRIAGTAAAFPGQRGRIPLLVADADSLEQAAAQAHVSLTGASVRSELWSRDDSATLLRSLRAARIPAERVVTAQQVQASPSFLALSWTFQFLEALGVLAGLLTVLGLLLYLESRQRAEEVAYALTRRMGLSRRAHRTSIAIELSCMLLCAFILGGVVAVGAAFLVHGRLDPLPSLPPHPVLRIPTGAIVVWLGLFLVAGWGGAWLVQRKADRTNVAEVMRVGA